MASEYDTVEINAQGAANGLAAWNIANESFMSQYNQIISTINSTHGKVPWGSDGPGTAFIEQYKGVEFMDDQHHTATIQALKDVGPAVNLALETNLQADEDQGAEVDTAKGKFESSRVDV